MEIRIVKLKQCLGPIDIETIWNWKNFKVTYIFDSCAFRFEALQLDRSNLNNLKSTNRKQTDIDQLN